MIPKRNRMSFSPLRWHKQQQQQQQWLFKSKWCLKGGRNGSNWRDLSDKNRKTYTHTHLNNEHTLGNVKNKERKRLENGHLWILILFKQSKNKGGVVSLNFLEMVSIAAMLAVFLAPEQKHRRLILFSSVMNICVYSEQKSLRSCTLSLLHTFKWILVSLAGCMGLFVRAVESIYGFGESDRRECGRLASVPSLHLNTLA